MEEEERINNMTTSEKIEYAQKEKDEKAWKASAP